MIVLKKIYHYGNQTKIAKETKTKLQKKLIHD